jgi:hypothetical protein
LARHRSIVVAIAAFVLLGASVVTGPAVRADADPVAERATITYRLDRARQRIDARGSFRFTNRIPVQRVGDRVRRIYLDRWGPIAISADATNLRVRPRSVKVQRIPTGGPFDNLVFSFPRIYNGGSVSFTATWNVPGRAGASSTGTVVSAPYSHFCWTGQPVDSGTISLMVPRDLEVVNQGSPVRSGRKGTQRLLTARGDLATFHVCTDIYDPSLLVRRDLVSPRGHAVTVEGLPGHDAWLEATSDSVREALAGVEAVVGAPLPGDDVIKVREVPTGALQGYAGDFDLRSRVVRIGDQGASVGLLSHELSHAWFNGDTLSDNWLWEGFAEWSSREATGFPCDRPVEPPFGDRPDLGDWMVLQAGSASFQDQALVQWQYEAACAIQGQVAAAIGPERMRHVIAVLLSGDSPYDLLPAADGSESVTPTASPTDSAPVSREPLHLPPGGAPSSPGASASPMPSAQPTVPGASATRSSKRRTRPVDWRQWLDIVDEAGLAPAGIADLTFAEHLLVDAGVIRRRAVRGRAEARASFHELQALAPSGITPRVVRRALDSWDFELATREMRLARQVAERLGAATSSAERVSLWAEYESASSRQALQRLRDRVP